MKLGNVRNWLDQIAGRDSWQEARCLFIVGMGRCGSGTAIRLMNLSPQTVAFHHPKPSLLALSAAAWTDPEGNKHEHFKAFRRLRNASIGDAQRSKRIYVEFDNLYSLLPMLYKYLRNSSFLHLYRHPGDAIRSGMRRGWYRGHSWDPYRPQPLANDRYRGQWDEHWDEFAKICWVWHAIHDRILAAKKELAAERFLSLSSEALWNIHSGAYRKIFEHLGIPVPPEDEVRRVLTVKHNAQESGQFPEYVNWTEHQKRVLRQIAGHTMDKLGYE